MSPQSHQVYLKLLTDIMHKEMIVLGPAPTLLKAKAIKGLHVSDNGSVTGIEGDPQEITRLLIENLMEFSESAVRKSVEPILSIYPGVSFAELGIAPTAQPAPTPDIPQSSSDPAPEPTLPPQAQQ